VCTQRAVRPLAGWSQKLVVQLSNALRHISTMVGTSGTLQVPCWQTMVSTAGRFINTWPHASPHGIRSRERSGAQTPLPWPVLAIAQALQRIGSWLSQVLLQQKPSMQNVLRHQLFI
jgi:hypothetical protein